MAESASEEERKKLRAAENLGWLAGSGTYSKKRKLIEGKDCDQADAPPTVCSRQWSLQL